MGKIQKTVFKPSWLGVGRPARVGNSPGGGVARRWAPACWRAAAGRAVHGGHAPCFVKNSRKTFGVVRKKMMSFLHDSWPCMAYQTKTRSQVGQQFGSAWFENRSWIISRAAHRSLFRSTLALDLFSELLLRTILRIILSRASKPFRAFFSNGLWSRFSTLRGNRQAWRADAHRDGNGSDRTAASAALHSENAGKPVTYCLSWPQSVSKALWREQYRVDKWSQSYAVPECSAESTPLHTNKQPSQEPLYRDRRTGLRESVNTSSQLPRVQERPCHGSYWQEARDDDYLRYFLLLSKVQKLASSSIWDHEPQTRGSKNQ